MNEYLTAHMQFAKFCRLYMELKNDLPKPNRLAAKLRAKTCELCGEYTNEVQIHQVKRLKDLTGQSEWEAVMLKNRRKTLAVCPACHCEIHAKD